jgi:hypothetical protein
MKSRINIPLASNSTVSFSSRILIRTPYITLRVVSDYLMKMVLSKTLNSMSLAITSFLWTSTIAMKLDISHLSTTLNS